MSDYVISWLFTILFMTGVAIFTVYVLERCKRKQIDRQNEDKIISIKREHPEGNRSTGILGSLIMAGAVIFLIAATIVQSF